MTTADDMNKFQGGGLTAFATTRLFKEAAILVILAAGFLLRVHDIDATAIWKDEAVSWTQASTGSFWGMIAATAKDNYPPLHNMILYGTIQLFGDSIIALRMPSVILGTATIYLVYRLGCGLFDRLTGIIASLLLAASIFHVWYSIEARMYALHCFTAALYVWSAVHALKSGSLRSHLLCAVSGLLLLYSHVFGMFVFAGINTAILVYALMNKAKARNWLPRWMLCQMTAGILFLPWAIILVMRSQSSLYTIGWIPPISINHMSQSVMDLVGGPAMIWAVSLVLIMGLAATRIARPADHRPASQQSRTVQLQLSLLLLLCWIVVPLVLAVAFSVLSTSIILERYMIGLLPAFCLLIGFLISDLLTSPLLRAAAVLLCIVPTLLDLPRVSEPPWRRQLAQEFTKFEELRRQGDVVVVLDYHDSTFKYNVRDWNTLELVTDLKSLDGRTLDRFWLIELGKPQPERVVRAFKRAGFEQAYRAQNPRVEFSLFVSNAAASRP